MSTYPTNSAGESYGPVQPDIDEPDLIEAIGLDGTLGYVRRSDLAEVPPADPAEAARRGRQVRTIELVGHDGRTVLGSFRIGGAPIRKRY